MRLVIVQDGVSIEFVEPRTAGAYPWLVGVGTLLLAASGGHLDGAAVGESANVDFDLDNQDRQAATLLGRPIRALATLYDDADDELFAGLISDIRYGPKLEGTIEA